MSSIRGVITDTTLTYANEDELQASITESLTTAGYEPARETPLSTGGRIDILCGTTGIEIKVAGSMNTALRQLQRYAHAPEISELILVTNRAKHHQIPDTIGGKPLELVSLIEGGL